MNKACYDIAATLRALNVMLCDYAECHGRALDPKVIISASGECVIEDEGRLDFEDPEALVRYLEEGPVSEEAPL